MPRRHFKTIVLVAFCCVLQGFSFAVYRAGTRPYNSWNPLLVHTLINFAAGSILWYSVGYTISFGTSQRVRNLVGAGGGGWHSRIWPTKIQVTECAAV